MAHFRLQRSGVGRDRQVAHVARGLGAHDQGPRPSRQAPVRGQQHEAAVRGAAGIHLRQAPRRPRRNHQGMASCGVDAAPGFSGAVLCAAFCHRRVRMASGAVPLFRGRVHRPGREHRAVRPPQADVYKRQGCAGVLERGQDVWMRWLCLHGLREVLRHFGKRQAGPGRVPGVRHAACSGRGAVFPLRLASGEAP